MITLIFRISYILLLSLVWFLVGYSHAEMGYFKATEVTTSGTEYSQEIDYEYWVYVYDPISGETVFMPPPEEDKPKKEKKQKYKTVARPWIKHTMTISPEATGAGFMSAKSGESTYQTHLGRDLREVAELKRNGWKAVILAEMRIGRWTKDNPPVFNRISVQQWLAEGMPDIALDRYGDKEIHAWRTMSGTQNRGARFEDVMEAIKE